MNSDGLNRASVNRDSLNHAGVNHAGVNTGGKSHIAHRPDSDAAVAVDSLPADLLPEGVIAAVGFLARRRLGRAALLFLAAHEPAAFWLGQGFYFLSPLYRLLMPSGAGENALDAWGEFCCRPESLATLEHFLNQATHAHSGPAKQAGS